MKHVLIIQTAFLGDVILALPLAQVLKRLYPEARVDFLAIPETSGIVQSHPDISKAIIYDKHEKHHSLMNFMELRAGLKKRGYDVVVCPHRSLRSALLASGTGAAVRIGFDRSAWKRSFTDLMPWKFGMHEVERNLSLLKPLGIEIDREEPRLYPDEKNAEEAARFLSTHGVQPPYAVVAPGTVWNTKRYPADSMREVVAGLLGSFERVVLIGGRKDLDVASKVAGADSRVVSAAGELPFMSSAELIRRASLLIANDSAPIHIASAFGTPTVAIFGPTVRDFGFYPYHRNSRVVEIDGLGCRPCSIHGGDHCPITTFECMRKITPETIVAAGLELCARSSELGNKND